MSRADVTAWETYVRGELERFYAHCDGVTYIWAHTPAADRLVARLGGDGELSAFKGPWHVIRRHLTAEFRQWVEEYEATERLTFSEWQARAVTERQDVAYLESAAHDLDLLAELRRLMGERDAIICEAAARGAAKTAIAAAIGLSRQQVHAIIAAGAVAGDGAGWDAPAAPVTPLEPGGWAGVPVDRSADRPAVEYRRLADGEIVEVF